MQPIWLKPLRVTGRVRDPVEQQHTVTVRPRGCALVRRRRAGSTAELPWRHKYKNAAAADQAQCIVDVGGSQPSV